MIFLPQNIWVENNNESASARHYGSRLFVNYSKVPAMFVDNHGESSERPRIPNMAFTKKQMP